MWCDSGFVRCQGYVSGIGGGPWFVVSARSVVSGGSCFPGPVSVPPTSLVRISVDFSTVTYGWNFVFRGYLSRGTVTSAHGLSLFLVFLLSGLTVSCSVSFSFDYF